MLEEPIQIIFGIGHLVCLFLEIGGGRNAPGHNIMLVPTLPQLHHIAIPSNWWQIHSTNGEQIDKTIWMEGPHHEWVNGIVTGMGRQHWWLLGGGGHAAKTRAGSNTRVAIGDFMVWAQKLDLSVHKNTIGKPTSRAIDLVESSTVKWYLLISEGEKVAPSYRFWLCPD
jgi:hypothetical protein